MFLCCNFTTKICVSFSIPFSPDGLQGDLASQLRGSADLKEFVLCPECLELGQVSSGLTHHPDGDVVNVFATGGAEDAVVF